MAATNKAKRRKESQDALRSKLRGTRYLRLIENITATPFSKILAMEDSETWLKTARFKVDTWLRLLNKELPDLKAIEVSGEIQLPQQMSKEAQDRYDEIAAMAPEPTNGERVTH